ncbi:helix-turn-helix domain-containing protein [Sciscionella marina]|uniref:helix-turn-helix domain-containing protein n=1 Tax=Sciscionella marina TaxID=508770 RepID=UPI0003A15D0C|nr:helix-turn-helix transcriptional regulator [Sciscionella marina]
MGTEDTTDPELARLLGALKERSGRTYEALARRSGLSRSSVHRYCTGRGRPPEFGTVERIAKACGVSRAELLDLHRAWLGTNIESAQLPGEPGQADPPSGERGADRPQANRRRAVLAVVSVILLSAAGVILAHTTFTTGTAHPENAGDPGVESAAARLSWSGSAGVPSSFFGVTMNSTSGVMPSFSVGSVRFWDSGTRWAQLQPGSGRYDWHILDRLVTSAERAHLPMVYVFGGTPEWASPNGDLGPYPDKSRTSPPTDLGDWDRFVTALADRYRQRIGAYELWSLADDRHFYSGDPATLVEMVRRAAGIIHRLDRNATVVCPSMGKQWTSEGQSWLRRFAELGGYRHCDAAGIKLYTRGDDDRPETMLDLVHTVESTFHRAGVQPPLWNTGTTFDIPLRRGVGQRTAVNYATRAYLVALYARYQRMYFYAWGGRKIPVVIQPEGARPSPAGYAIGVLDRWLAATAITGCGHGPENDLPRHTYRCGFTTPRERFAVYWTDRGTSTLPARRTDTTLRRVDGSTDIVPAGRPIGLDERPVRISEGA